MNEQSQNGSAEDSRNGKGDDQPNNDHEQDDAQEKKAAEGDQKKKKPKRHIPWWVWVLAAVIVVLAFLYWLIFVRGYEKTDDAYTDGRSVPMAAKVSGYVRTLAVNDNQRVRAGDLLLAIEAADYRVGVANADAQIASVQAQLESARLDVLVQRTSQLASLDSARAARQQARANLDRALADLKRQQSVNPLATTQQQTDQVAASAVLQRQTLRDAEAKVRTAELAPQNIAIAQTRVTQLEAQLQAAHAQRDQAQLNLDYTELRAPLDGFVTKRNVEVGSFVQAGQTLLNMVGTEVWITANFKEDQLRHMRTRQPVDIKVDAYPDLEISGHVDSWQLGSGSRFSAFPAENATGNFVKIVQRVPVKIVIDRGLDSRNPLPLGLSVIPRVNTR